METRTKFYHCDHYSVSSTVFKSYIYDLEDEGECPDGSYSVMYYLDDSWLKYEIVNDVKFVCVQIRGFRNLKLVTD